jgi:GntR family transcriptional regulator/MocR family aminotransferase
MARPLQNWDLTLELPAQRAPQPVFVRIARAIAGDVRRGRLVPGAQLPGSRELARGLGVHRNTVIAAFRELLAEGYLEARKGQGTFVASALPEARPKGFARGRNVRVQVQRAGFDLPPFATPDPVYAPPPKGTLALFGGLPDLRLLPGAAFARAYRRVLRKSDVLNYGDPRGHARLREALAIMLRAQRGLSLSPDDILVTRGSQMALALGARTVLAPGDVVAVEAYGYRPAWTALRGAGVRLVPLPVDHDGLRVDALAELCERERVRGVYVTPHHQYPTTATLSAPRRLALLELAARKRFAIFEDDYDHEFHYEGRPILPLARADVAGTVVYVGTLSKVLAPALRIGYMVAPHDVLARVTAERFYLDRQGDQVTECAIAELLEDGELQRHVRRTRRHYARRRDVFVSALRSAFGERLKYRVPQGGMALWAAVDARVSVERWLAQCAERGVLFQAGKQFHFGDRAVPYARMGYAALTEPEIAEAVRRLERAWRAAAR